MQIFLYLNQRIDIKLVHECSHIKIRIQTFKTIQDALIEFSLKLIILIVVNLECLEKNIICL